MNKLHEIKSLNDFKKYNIICTTTEEVKECLLLLNKTDEQVKDIKSVQRIVSYSILAKCYLSYTIADDKNKDINFYHFKKVYNRLKKQEKEKEKLPDFEVASDGRVMEINNYKCNKLLSFLAVDFNNENIDDPVGNANETLCCNYDSEEMGFYRLLKYGLLFKNEEALDNYLFKLTIETKLKNIAERLNAGRKIDWNDINQAKSGLYYSYGEEKICLLNVYRRKSQGVIYCLDQKFLDVAKQEIGEENLIKYFTE